MFLSINIQPPMYHTPHKRKAQETNLQESEAKKRGTTLIKANSSKNLLMCGGSFSRFPVLDMGLFGVEEEDSDEEQDDLEITPPLRQDRFERSDRHSAAIVPVTELPSSSARPQTQLVTATTAPPVESSGSLPLPPPKTLHYAAEHGDLHTLQAQLMRKADPNQTNHLGQTPLIAAAAAGQDKAVAFLLDPKNPLLLFHMEDDEPDEIHHLVILSHSDNDGNTAFTKAAANGHAGIMKQLMHAMGDDAERMIRHQNQKGETALMLAAAAGNIEGVRLILKEDVKQVKKDENMTYTPSYTQQDHAGKNAVQHALAHNRQACADLILKYERHIENIW